MRCLDRDAKRGTGDDDPFRCSGGTRRCNHNGSILLHHGVLGLEHRDRACPLDWVGRQRRDGRTAAHRSSQGRRDFRRLNRPELC
jgi:hypothetical protein